MSKINYLDEWRIEENLFDPNHLGKYEAIMTLGNGYLGVRNVHEEEYPHETRGMFIAGIFNKFSEAEVTELANFPDITTFEIRIDGELFSLLKGSVENYHRIFNYRTGESTRTFIWKDSFGRKLFFSFRKFASMKDKHLLMINVQIKNLGKSVKISLKTGINNTKTNSGSQHFEEGSKRYFENKYLYLRTNTTETKIQVAIAAYLDLDLNADSRAIMERRNLQEVKSFELDTNEITEATKYVMIRTQRDLEFDGDSYLKDELLSSLSEATSDGYASALEQSVQRWQNIWEEAEIKIESNDFRDQLLLNFARYHLHIMSPVHDDRLNIGAKGMSGEGYKGHTFWDTEIFILPYFIYTFPELAKSLVNYRIKGLEAAKANAKANGYQGAQYPWEAAWLTDGEVTPKFGDIDILTGKPAPILTGEIEHHVTSDVVYGITEYVLATQDHEVADRLFDVVMAAASFWCSRCSYNGQLARYEINDVIGPDEYKEHVNNNAYTNYLAKFTLDRAIEEYSKRLDCENLNLEKYREVIVRIKEVAAQIYLPQVNQNQILPQDDTYLQKSVIDLTNYLNDNRTNTLFMDYNLAQVNEMQLSKQADVLLLLLLFSEHFSPEVLQANWNYYYPKTLHESSLSLCTHCNYALLIGKEDLAYQLFKKSFEIDLGSKNMVSSDMGIHAASMGGVWQNVVKGFGGFSIKNDEVLIDPKLPAEWQALTYTVIFHGTKMRAVIQHDQLLLERLSGMPVKVKIRQKEYQLEKQLIVTL